ncbi:MAG: hypothetical protein DI547_13830 [Sphingobium sp.]|nr:MAG: hypothetical protein DI547_13830 [Sphingobium sp.]
MTPTARTGAAIVAVLAWAGLVVQFTASFDATGSTGQTLWVLLRFFTILTNLLVAVLFSGIAFGNDAWASPRLVGGTMLAILLVGIVYGLLLSNIPLPTAGGSQMANILLHKVTPVAVPLWWTAFARKGGTTHRDPWLWALYPLAYLPYALARGMSEGVYAYPFINLDRLGWGQVLANAAMIALGFLVAGHVVVAIDQRLSRRQR